MSKLKAGEYGVRVFGGRISAATELANSLASNTSASEAITATATAAKALTAGVAQLNSMLQKIQGDLGQVDSNLQTANRSLGDTNARLKTNQNALAAIPRDSLNILGVQEQEDVDKANKNLAKKRSDLNKKISNDQANASSLTAKITLLNQQKWSFSVLANRILQSINKINTTHDTLIPVRDKLVTYNESAGLGYLKFSVLAKQSQNAFETLWRNLNKMDNESRFNIYNASIMNMLDDKTHDGHTMEEFAPILSSIGVQFKKVDLQKASQIMDETERTGYAESRWPGTRDYHDVINENDELKFSDIDGDGIANIDEADNGDDMDGDSTNNAKDKNPFVNDVKFSDPEGEYANATDAYSDTFHKIRELDPNFKG